MRSNTEQQPGRLAKASSLGARQASAKPSAPASARATARSTSARPMASPGAGEGNAATSVALAELRELYAQKGMSRALYSHTGSAWTALLGLQKATPIQSRQQRGYCYEKHCEGPSMRARRG